MHKSIRIDLPKRRLDLEVRLERQEPHEGQLTTDLKPIEEPHNRLSISAGLWDRRGPRSPWREDMFGQCRVEVLSFARECSAEQRAALERLCAIWAEWHLNDMSAGTAAQTALVEAARSVGEVHDGDYYGTACNRLAEAGLLVDRGYRYGTRWLVRLLPATVAAEVLSLCDQLQA